MAEVTGGDVITRLQSEFPRTDLVYDGESLYVSGAQAAECRARGRQLVTKAKLFNAHAACGHVSNKRAWWKRV